MTILQILLIIPFLLSFIGFSAFTLTSWQEKQKRATTIAIVFALLAFILGITSLLIPPMVQTILIFVLGVILVVAIILFLMPVGRNYAPSPPPTQRVDERTIMFARARLQPGSSEFKVYYAAHPEHHKPDSAFRKNPGLLEPGGAFYDALLASSPDGSFFLTECLRDAVDGSMSTPKSTLSLEKSTHFIKNLAKYHGAVDVGICKLAPYHIYSHIGRGSGEYGTPIKLNHHFAIAFTVEMAYEMIEAAPQMPSVMESARQYAEAGKIAVILAAAIRDLGYPARAHIDGNYRVIAPLVAKDAGLGEIGRMGLLMTPNLGPRVRLGVVTTSLPLIPDPPSWEPSVIDFCEYCNKCAEVCPLNALPFGTRQTYPDGTLRWKIDPERCYTYWTKIGTDCGRCMAVCPYSHADKMLHNFIRWGVKHSGNFRRAAVLLDDLFYGKKPLPHAAPGWLQ
ncbi:MAG: 4Fe-4S dicluster domain-containing protein, partial [Anaerolineales bacterium]